MRKLDPHIVKYMYQKYDCDIVTALEGLEGAESVLDDLEFDRLCICIDEAKRNALNYVLKNYCTEEDE